MGTAGAAALIALLCVSFLYSNAPVWLKSAFDNSDRLPIRLRSSRCSPRSDACQSVDAGHLRRFLRSVRAGRVLADESADQCEFLIATDSEMKR